MNGVFIMIALSVIYLLMFGITIYAIIKQQRTISNTFRDN